jgi:hypothetical protein
MSDDEAYDDVEEIEDDEVEETEEPQTDDDDIDDTASEMSLLDYVDRDEKTLISTPVITSYESAAIIGKMATMIEYGYPVHGVPEHLFRPYDIAKYLFNKREIPMDIIRPVRGNEKETVHFQDLIIL